MTIVRMYPLGTVLRRFTGHTPRRSDAAGVESLTSFFCRLALHHYCAPHRLYGALIVDDWSKKKGNFLKVRSAESHLINGFGQAAKSSVEALKKESNISDPEEMTFFSISNLCDQKAKHFLHKGRHWCAQCYIESRKAGESAWDPLYWAPATTKICLVHKTLLREACPQCARPQRHLPKFPLLDFCEYCGFDLASEDPNPCNPEQLNQQIWLANDLLDLIKNHHNIILSRENFSSHINEAIRTCSNGSFRDFSLKTGINAVNIRNWQLRSVAPTWSNVIDVSYRLNTPLTQLAGPTNLFFDPENFNYKKKLRLDKRHRCLSKEKIRELRKATIEILKTPIDVWFFRRGNISAILKQFDISLWTFQRHLGDLADEISAKRKESAEFRKQFNAEERRRRLRNARDKLAEMELVPSVRNLKKSGMVKVSDVIPVRRGKGSSEIEPS